MHPSSSVGSSGTNIAQSQQPATNMAVLFADIAGSTKLYDTLGDTQAKRMVDECIALMADIVRQHRGRVIKTIGDEVMCVLPDADKCCVAAIDMQLKIMALPEVSKVKRTIRVGFHFGPVLEDGNDVFGDTVNLAARMAGVAKAMQIMTTLSTVGQLSPMLHQSTRRIASLSVKGKADDVEICEVLWQEGAELTTMATTAASSAFIQTTLRLQCGDRVLSLQPPSDSILLGRDETCQLIVADRMASRHHARIDRRRDKFFLVDQSSNGTFLVVDGEAEITLRREEVMLRGEGTIAFGRSVAKSSDDTVRYTVQI